LIEDLQHRVSAFHFDATEQPLPEIKVDAAKLTLESQDDLVHW
jgi:hypothetical protein